MLHELQRDTLKERRKRNRLSIFYTIQHGQTGIDTVKYLKPLDRVGRHVNDIAYDY